MGRVLFSVYFLLVPIISVLVLSGFKITVKGNDVWLAFESSLPIIVIYYLAVSIVWVINLDRIKETT